MVKLDRVNYRARQPFDIDALGQEIALWGRTGKSMPPAWAGAGMTIPMKGPAGEHLGHLLPGRGAYVDCDLKELGLTRPIPHIVQRGFVRRLSDRIDRLAQTILGATGLLPDPVRAAIWLAGREPFLRGQAGTITSYDGIIAARAGGNINDVWIGKASLTSTSTDWYTMARAAGTPGAMSFNSTTAPTQTACDRATAGAWSLGLFNPGGANKKYLLTFGMNASQIIQFAYLVDIHVQGGSFRLTTTGAETVASPVTIVRNYYPLGPLGAGCWMVGVTTTAASATATNLTATYVDQDGNTGVTTTIASPATATVADQLWPDSSTAAGAMPFWALASGDYGVRSMSQTQSSVGLAGGALAVLLVTPLTAMPGVASNVYVERDSTVQIDGLTELVASGGTIGCLNLLLLANTTSTGTLSAFIRTTEG